MKPEDIPPPKPYSNALAKKIFEWTARRDNRIIDAYQGIENMDERRTAVNEIKVEWMREVERGCQETVAHAENLIENLKKLQASIDHMRTMIPRAPLPTDDGGSCG